MTTAALVTGNTVIMKPAEQSAVCGAMLMEILEEAGLPPGVLNVVTKSGTQAFHGSGYWYGRRSEWNANTWLNKRVTPEVPLPKASRARASSSERKA